MASPLSLRLPTHSSATQATSTPNHRAGLHLKEHECSSSACTPPPDIPSLSSPLAGWSGGSCPSPLSLAGEGGLLLPQGRLPKAAAVRSRRQGGKKKKKRAKKRRSGGGGIREGGGESCTFLRAERASPRRGPSPRSCLPSPGPPTWQQQHRLLCSPPAPPGAIPASRLDPPAAPHQPRGSAARGRRDTQTLAGPRWEAPRASGFGEPCTTT